MASEGGGKKMRKICLDSTAPNGYHYDGEPGKLFEGKPTIRLRRDKEGTRDELYADLYCEIQGEDIFTVKYIYARRHYYALCNR